MSQKQSTTSHLFVFPLDKYSQGRPASGICLPHEKARSAARTSKPAEKDDMVWTHHAYVLSRAARIYRMLTDKEVVLLPAAKISNWRSTLFT